MMHTYFFHFDVVSQILQAMQTGKTQIHLSLDLNLTHKTWQIEDSRLILGADIDVDSQMLSAIASDKTRIFVLKDKDLMPLEIRSQGYYKLVPTSSAPTLEINGIKMHRSKDIDPLTDAQLKTQRVVSPGDQTLDTCGGLGYSAVFALKAGAKKVVSFEKSREVVALRNQNPWLEKYADDRLELIHADVVQKIDAFDNGRFNSVIHDPPRFTSATGDLYGKKFYDALFRVMTSGAKLFHYTGSPKKIKTRDRFIKNTIQRLEHSGFKSLEFHEHLQGVYGRKR
ncbi:MAG: hypothetical protein KKE62_18125 [Proteobacteria bacterium]|nr:hypothetical protein [Pseudomonadota bacterium]MBU1386810.1 hypothetical protein [Pseudomonadota bacterium]MBU1544754.1 hypothetical protein [Pseudomonadota bacterium]MBU2483019.1 hypothetical protein [Pseudomonadota bacterium]